MGTSFAFDPLSFDKATTRWFVVKEDDSAKLGGVSYSTATYHVTLTAAPDAAGGALAVTETVTDAGGMASALVFENRYGAAAYELYLSGRKELEGRTLGDGEFSFALYAYDDTAEQCKGAPLGTAANDENGRFVFDKQLLSAADQVYRYVIVEDGSAAAVGMTYDSTVYVVTVTVEDNGAGSMVLKEQTITKLGETDVLAEVLFKNIYVAPTPTPSPVPTATPKPTATPAPTSENPIWSYPTAIPETEQTVSTASHKLMFSPLP